MAVDLFGGVPDIAGIEALGVPVVEDAAQAAGTRTAAGMAGALGSVATLSFFPSKNLGAFGDGGAVITGDPELAERVRMLRFHGSRDKQTFELVGHNSRLDELHAAMLRVLLTRLDAWAEGRRAAMAHYVDAGLGEHVTLPTALAGVEPAWHLCVVRHDDPAALEAALAGAGVGHKAYYRVPVHAQPAMRPWAPPAGSLPATDEAARTHLAIPMSAVLSRAQADEVVAAVRKTASAGE
jgi:dTDP-4-amino-4,6-dideoxygalactose transaminase